MIFFIDFSGGSLYTCAPGGAKNEEVRLFY